MWGYVLRGIVTDEFDERLGEALDNYNLTVEQFADRYEIPESTLYKITSGHRTNFGVDTLRKIVHGLKSEEGHEGPTIGLITTRGACDRAPTNTDINGTKYHIKPLPAHSIEEEIIKGVRAEREGVDGLVCGPIAASTLEQVVDIPVGGLQFDDTLVEESINAFAQKISQ